MTVEAKRSAKAAIWTSLMMRSNGPRSAYDLWFDIDIQPQHTGALTETEVKRYLDQQASRKHGNVKKVGAFYRWTD